MKRKADQLDESSSIAQPVAEPSFADFGLDPRLVQAVASQGFEKPTPVQQKAIPLALNGQDVLAKAPCGSGKTAAYVLPLLASILKRKSTDSAPFTAALILVPTRELADQCFKAVEQLSAFCSKDVQAAKLTDKHSDAVQRSLLSNSPDIVIATPGSAWHNINTGALSLDQLTHAVLDEADLVLSYGYQDDLQNLAKFIPRGVALTLMSATLTADVDTLKDIFRRKPTLLDLREPEADGDGLTQYVVKCGEDEKFLLTYLILKLQLIKGKSIIFVSDIDRSYRLKLFLQQFGIRSCILNSELPVNSRINCVEEFNSNVYDIIIASDEHEVLGVDDEKGGDEEKTEEKGEVESRKTKRDAEEGRKDTRNSGDKDARHPKKKRKTKRDREYGVSRGIDFKNVAAVINFDLPQTASSYTHRTGRTARAGRTGIALSFVIPQNLYRKHIPTTTKSAESDEKVLAKIIRQQAKLGREVKPYHFDQKQVEAFRYRMNDALRAITKVAIREARTRELRQELLNSEKLKRYFEENPAELKHLRHDGELRTARQQPHLKHVPEYLLPKDGKRAITSEEVGFVPFKKEGKQRGQRRGRGHGRGFKVGGRKGDPLKTFKARHKAK